MFVHKIWFEMAIARKVKSYSTDKNKQLFTQGADYPALRGPEQLTVPVACVTTPASDRVTFSLHPAVKPRIVRDNLAPVTVKVNQQVMLDVDIIGEPPPTVTWTFKDKVRPVRASPRHAAGSDLQCSSYVLFRTSCQWLAMCILTAMCLPSHSR